MRPGKRLASAKQPAVHYLSTLIVILFVSFGLQAQIGHSVYGSLDTLKAFQQSCYLSNDGGTSIYKVNGVITDSLTYESCQKNYALLKACTPCWLKMYTGGGDTLLYEMVAYGDCGVGAIRQYYPSGKLKLQGSYQESTDWDSTGKLKALDCSIKNGSWVYYKEDGSFWYDETWRNGRFIEQVPNLGKSEVWGIDLTFFGGQFHPDKDILRLDLLSKLTISPQYKNANRTAEVTGEIQVVHIGGGTKTTSFTPASYPYLSPESFLPESDTWDKKDLRIFLRFYVDGAYFRIYQLQFY